MAIFYDGLSLKNDAIENKPPEEPHDVEHRFQPQDPRPSAGYFRAEFCDVGQPHVSTPAVPPQLDLQGSFLRDCVENDAILF